MSRFWIGIMKQVFCFADRIGGVILFHAKDEAEMKQIISEDPFHINGIASYEMIEFNPTKCAPNFQCFTEK